MSEVTSFDEMTSKDVRHLAEDAGKLIGSIGPMINHLTIPVSRRNSIATTLFASSLHHGAAICALIETERANFGGPALTLHRAQQEQFLRGAFFAQHATEEEIDHYAAKNELPRTHAGKKLTTKQLALVVESTFQGCGTEYSASFERTWSALCGYVHGGTEIIDLYLTPNGIRSELAVDRAAKIVSRALSQAMMVLVVMSRLGDVRQPTFKERFADAYAEFIRLARLSGTEL